MQQPKYDLVNSTAVIADDHAILRTGIAEQILPAAGLRAVASVPDAASALAACSQHKPDLLLLDLEMPGRDSLSIVPEVRSLSEHTKIVIFSGFCAEALVQRALRLNVRGYILKTESVDAVANALRDIMAGGTYFSPGVRAKLRSAAEAAQDRESITRLQALTPRELEVLRYIGQGMDNASMAQTMHLSKRTVERHVSRLMNSLRVNRRPQLLHLAVQTGVVMIDTGR